MGSSLHSALGGQLGKGERWKVCGDWRELPIILLLGCCMRFLEGAYTVGGYLSLQIRPVPLMKGRLLHNARLAEWALKPHKFSCWHLRSTIGASGSLSNKASSVETAKQVLVTPSVHNFAHALNEQRARIHLPCCAE